jgi:superfamily II DNA helicase RecQ
MPDSVEEVLRKYWGFGRFLPPQKQAMECVCRGRDSIVVRPTVEIEK